MFEKTNYFCLAINFFCMVHWHTDRLAFGWDFLNITFSFHFIIPYYSSTIHTFCHTCTLLQFHKFTFPDFPHFEFLGLFCHQIVFKQALVFTCLQYKYFENTVGKGENCSLWAISLFPTVFSSCLENFLPSSSKSILSSAKVFQFGRV